LVFSTAVLVGDDWIIKRCHRKRVLSIGAVLKLEVPLGTSL
jgi:hypothetical protein